MLRFFLVGILLISSLISIAQDSKKQRWVDSVFLKLKPEEKIGQLIFPLLSTNPSSEEINLLGEKIKANKIGGIRVEKNSPLKFAQEINKLQANAKIPLLVTTDVTTVQSFDSLIHFYNRSVVSAIENDTLKKNIDAQIALQAKLLGIQIIQDETLKTFELGTKDVDVKIKTIKKSLKKDKLLKVGIDSMTLKILNLKYNAGLLQNKFINIDNLIQKLNSFEAQLLKQRLAEAAITVVRNDFGLIPIKTIENRNFASISIGVSSRNEFTYYLSKYALFNHYSIQTFQDTTSLKEKLKAQDVIVIGLFAPTTDATIETIKKLAMNHQLIICDFTNLQLKSFEDVSSLIAAYSSDSGLPQAAAEIIFGGIGAKGKLPNAISDSLRAGTSIKTYSLNRFAYQLPEAAGMDSKTLEKIEPIANEAISIGATPGCQVLIAKDGKVIYEKSFGTLTYKSKNPVTDETIFDLASITKVSATLQAVMHLQEKGLIDINKKVSAYLPELKETNKEDFIIKDILTHQAGLWPFLPFWAETVKDSSTWKKYYSKTENGEYPFPVSENMFASKFMKDSLWQWIIKARIRDKTARTVYDYRYSDMGFYIMQHLAEKLLGVPMEDFLQKKFYQPLGAYTTGYLPLRRFSLNRIAPTEKDTLFRKSLLIGYVHDQGAAMHGGIAGHAGLFSTANDLAKLGQMWLNHGSYGGIQFFKPETLDLFTAKQFENSRRGLGWDKPLLNDPNGPTSMYASAKTFGHTGFTGTSIWIDPEFNLIFIFMSNRVYPDMNNTKILNANIRPRIQDIVYHSIFEYCKK